MTNIINSAQCYSSPTMYWTIQYEYQRSGANMQYRFYWKVWVGSGSWFDDGLQLQLFLDGTQHNVTVKGYQTNNKGWSYEGTTGWYTVNNKTSGTTSFYARLYDTNEPSVKVTSSTYSLAVSGAASVLGSIADFNVEGSIPIAITKYDTAFVDTLEIYCGGVLIKTVVGITNGTTVSFVSGELNAIFSIMSTERDASFTFKLTTKSGSSYIGTSTTIATGTITNANPTFTESQVTYEDINATVYNITGNPQHIVQNKSSLRVTFGQATGNKGARILQYVVIVNGVTKSSTESGYIDFGAVNTSQNTTITVRAIDSRWNITTVTKEVTILAYAPPTFTVELERLNNYEDETYLTVNSNIASVNGKNTMDISYNKKQSGGNYGTDIALTNKVKHTTSCDKNYSYVFSVTVADKFESVTLDYVLPKGRFPLFIDTEKNAVGINEFPSEGEALRVSGGVANLDSLKVGGVSVADFVVEVGTSGIWKYKKWNSGEAELYGIATIHATENNIDMPDNLLVEATFGMATILKEINIRWEPDARASIGADAVTSKVWASRESSTGFQVNLIVKGRWK